MGQKINEIEINGVTMVTALAPATATVMATVAATAAYARTLPGRKYEKEI